MPKEKDAKISAVLDAIKRLPGGVGQALKVIDKVRGQFKNPVSVDPTWNTPAGAMINSTSGSPKIDSTVGKELGTAAAALASPAIISAAPTLVPEVVAFEAVNQAPKIVGGDSFTGYGGMGAEWLFRKAMPDGEWEDALAPYVNSAGQFIAGIPVGIGSHNALQGAKSVMHDAISGIRSDIQGMSDAFSGNLIDIPATYDEQAILQAEQDMLRGTREEARRNFADRMVGYRQRLQQLRENMNGMPVRDEVLRRGVDDIRVPYYDARAANAGLAPNDPDFINVFRERAIAGREREATLRAMQRDRRRLMARNTAVRNAQEDLRFLERDYADLQRRAEAAYLDGGAPSGEVQDAMAELRAQMDEVRSTITRNGGNPYSSPRPTSGELATAADIDAFLEEEARNAALDRAIREDVASQSFDFVDIPSSDASISRATRQIRNDATIGDEFSYRYGISVEEARRLLGPAPGGRQRDLHDITQTFRNMETEAGGLGPLRSMIENGERGLLGGATLSGVTPELELIYDAQFGRSPIQVAEAVRRTGRPVESMSQLSTALREFEGELGSREAVVEAIKRGTLGRPNRAGRNFMDLVEGGSYGMTPLTRSGNIFSEEELAEAVSGLGDSDLTKAYIGRMKQFVSAGERNGKYFRNYNDTIERDKTFRVLADEMQRRFGSQLGESKHFRDVAGTNYDDIALWIRSTDSPYSVAGEQYLLPGDITSQSWGGSASEGLNGSGITPAEAAESLFRTIPRGSALATTGPYGSTSIDSYTLPMHQALGNYGTGPGQATVHPFVDEFGIIDIGDRNAMGNMSKWRIGDVVKDFETAASSPGFSKIGIDFSDPVKKLDFETFLRDPSVITDDAAKKTYRDFVAERLAARRKTILTKMDRPWLKVAEKEGWSAGYIPKAEIRTELDREVNNILQNFRVSGMTRLETPYTPTYMTIKHDMGGPLLLNPYAGGGDFDSVKQRPDYKANLVQKFIQDVVGPMYYPNPVNVHGDYSRFYFGRPTKKDTFYKSKFRPTKSSDAGAVYYGVKDPLFLNDLVHLYNTSINSRSFLPVKPLLRPGDSRILDGYYARSQSHKDSAYIGDAIERHLPWGDNPIDGISASKYPITDSVGALGNFTVSRGKDDTGDYLSYYDKWDLNGFTDITKNVEKYGVGRPYEIYDRIYGNFDDDGTFHPLGEIPASVVTPDSYASGGKIHIKPSHRGRLTELKARTGKTEAELYNDGNPAHKKMVVFARNARKWKHADGGPLNSFPNGGKFITTLSPDREDSFMKDWQAFASLYNLARNPDDPEHYYDYRGFWDANKKSYAVNPFTWETKSTDGHLPDTWKTPGHPTFSVESIYAKDAPGLAGHWEEGVYIPPEMVDQDAVKLRQRYAESAFNDAAKSPAGALGAFQIMPKTGEEYARRMNERGDLLDAAYNERMRDYIWNDFYNSELASKGNPLDTVRTAKALAMYNWGRGNVATYLNNQKAKGADIYGSLDWVEGLPKETRDYINFILLNKDVPDTSKTQTAFEKAAKAYGYSIGGRIDHNKLYKTYGKLIKAYGGDISRIKEVISKLK